MAIPRTLKKIDKDDALKIIDKHIDAGTGKWEFLGGDFVYRTGNRLYLIRETWGHYETGLVSQ